jgi:hypothetical protein
MHHVDEEAHHWIVAGVGVSVVARRVFYPKARYDHRFRRR